MRVKRRRQQAPAMVKKEDTDDVLPVELTSTGTVESTLPDHQPVHDLGAPEDTKPTASHAGRVRLFVDAVVVAKWKPEARFDRRYRRMSSLEPTDPCPHSSTRARKRSLSPLPALRSPRRDAARRPIEGLSPRVKLEARDDVAFAPDPRNPDAEEIVQPSAALQDDRFPVSEVGRPIKVREESPDPMPLDSVRSSSIPYIASPNVDEVASKPVPPTTSNPQLTDEEAVERWKNPKAKVKKEGTTLTVDSIKARLTEAGISMNLFPIDCDKGILDASVSREFISNKWGGSSQETFSKIGKKKLAEHGLSDFMYLPGNYQPIAPQVPGAPGIWIDENMREGEWTYGIRRVFTRIQTGPALWMYQGQYEMKRARSMTREEWATQTPAVRNTWARELCRKRWGIGMRINIYAINEWGTMPTKAEREDIYDRRLYVSIGVQEVALALTRGDATMGLYTMKCVGYDKKFAKQVMERWDTWVAPVRRPKGLGKRKAGGEPKAEGGQKRLTKRQKLEEDVINVDDLHSDDDDASSESGEEYDEDEPESEPELDVQDQVYRPRGTRTRPRT